MIIGIDASRAVNEEGGIGRYTREVASRLVERGDGDQFRLFFSFMRDDGRKKRWIDDLVSHKESVQIKTSAIPGQLKEWLWGQSWWSITRYMPGVDVIFAPSFFEAAVGEKTPQVVMMHDLSHALFPDQRGSEVSKRLTERNRIIAHKAARLLAPSQATKDDLVRLFDISADKIDVIPHGYNQYFQVVEGIEREPFFLFVGTVSPRKNIIGILESYARLPQDIRDEYTIKVVGSSGWNTGPTYDTLKRLGLENRVTFLGYQGDEDLRRLYNQAAAFLFPSLYEGFGIPILEAMACGCPVITSNVSSMPEVAGDAALLVDPNEPDDLARAVEQVVTEPKLWSRLRKAGLEQVTAFSWEKTVARTLEILHDVGRQ